MSRYDADDVYCIPGTAVLNNKAGITDQDQLDEYEGGHTLGFMNGTRSRGRKPDRMCEMFPELQTLLKKQMTGPK